MEGKERREEISKLAKTLASTIADSKSIEALTLIRVYAPLV